MHIFIPTLNRVEQLTYRHLPPKLRQQVIFISPERMGIPDGAAWIPQPSHVKGIGPTRQYILDYSLDCLEDPAVVMLDDDLRFATRREDDPSKFRDSTPEEVEDLFVQIERLLDKGYAHVGVSTREGGNREIARMLYNTRLLRVLCYRSDILKQEGVRFDRIHLMEDFDVTLQLLRKGYTNVKINWIVHDQKGSNVTGGCSTYRTMEEQARAAYRLKELHPEFVDVVTKQTKTAWGGQERTDVRIQWKRAYNAG